MFFLPRLFPLSGNISLQQTPYLSSFPITPRAVTQNYLRSILYLPEQTKAWECFQSQRGRSLPSRLIRLLTLTLPLDASHNKGGLKDATQKPRSSRLSISDRSLENVLHLVTQTRSEAVGLKFVWVCVQIGQLHCAACVCVRGTPSTG